MLTSDLEATLRRAGEEAIRRRHEYLLLEHLLLAILDDPRGIEVLKASGVRIDALRAELERHLTEDVEPLPPGVDRDPQQTLSFQRVLSRALVHMQSAGRTQADAGNVLAAIFREGDSHAVWALNEQGVTRFDVLRFISHGVSKGGTQDREMTPTGTSEEAEAEAAKTDDPLGAFCEDLVEKASLGKIDPLIGRDDELDRAMQVLCRRRKNNPVFVGDPGVGKTALAEGLALRIHNGEVPTILQGATIYALNMSAVLAGTRYRGDFEERIKALIDALKEQPDSILFIDEIHTVVGAGATSGGTMDASNMLKPPLASGELRCIGSTTWSEYKASFGKDRALARRFQKIDVLEPSVDETYKILKGLRERYEKHHKVTYTDSALKAAAELAGRFINDSKLPDKAIDVIDEAGAKVALMPEHKRRKTIRPRDIELVVARIARIPAKSINKDDKLKLADLETDLKRLIYGQDEAVQAVSTAIKLGRSGLGNADKPTGSFLFAGPTGVGKTELAKQLAFVLGVQFLRFDMSEYMEKHTVSRLIGAPPGYVGFDQGGLLTDAIIKNPHAVLVLDEIEKAHPDVFNILLQVMDHATLTDNNGRKADFRNVVLIMTTNAGARDMSRTRLGFAGSGDQWKGKNKELERAFSPEFRNRLDGIVYFNPLPPEVVRQVVDKFLDQLDVQLADKKVDLQVTEAAREWLAKEGYDEQFGARPMARTIHEHIKRRLVDELLFGSLQNGGVAIADVGEGGLVLTFPDAAAKPPKETVDA